MVHGRRARGSSTAETQEAEAGDKEKPFPQENSIELQLGTGDGGLSPALGVSLPDWVKS